MSEQLTEVLALMSNLDRRFSTHMEAEEAQYEKFNLELKRLGDEVEGVSSLIRAFPETSEGIPDLLGHHNDHATRMAEAQTSKKRWEQIKTSLITDGVKAILIATAVIFGIGLKDWIINLFKLTGG